MGDPTLEQLHKVAGLPPIIENPIKAASTTVKPLTENDMMDSLVANIKPYEDKSKYFAKVTPLTKDLLPYKNEGFAVNPTSVQGNLQMTANQTQDNWERLGNNLKISGANMVSTFIGGMLEVPQMFQNTLSSDEDFKMLSPIAEWRNSIQEENTSFRTPGDDTQGVLGYLKPTWWSGNTDTIWGSALESAGYGVGAIASTMLQEAAVTAVTFGSGTLPLLGLKIAQAARYISKMSKLDKLSDGLVQGKKLYDALKISQGLNIGKNVGKNILRSAYSSYVESAFEALEGKERVTQKLIQDYVDRNGEEPLGTDLDIIKSKASDASNTRFWANYIGLTITNLPYTKAMFSGFDKSLTLKDTFKDLGVVLGKDNKLVKDTVKLTGKFWEKNAITQALKTPTEFLLTKGKNSSISWSEGLEEGYQMMVEKGTENYFTHDYDKDTHDTVIGGIVQGFQSILQGANSVVSEEGIKAMLAGVIGGTYQSLGAKGLNLATGNTTDKKLDRKVGKVWVKEGNKYVQKDQTYREYIESQADGIQEFSKDLVKDSLDTETYNGTLASHITDFKRQTGSATDLLSTKNKLEHKLLQNSARFHSILPYVSKGYKDILLDKIKEDIENNDEITNKDEILQNLTSDVETVNKYYERMQETFSNPYSENKNSIEHGMYEHLKSIGTYHLYSNEMLSKQKEDILNTYGDSLLENPIVNNMLGFVSEIANQDSPTVKSHRDSLMKLYSDKINKIESDLSLASTGEAIIDVPLHRKKLSELKKQKRELGLFLNHKGYKKDGFQDKFLNKFYSLLDKAYEIETGKPLLDLQNSSFDNYEDIISNIYFSQSLNKKVKDNLETIKDLLSLNLKDDSTKLEWLTKYAERARDIAETKATFKSKKIKEDIIEEAAAIINASNLTPEAKKEAIETVIETIDNPKTSEFKPENTEEIIKEVRKVETKPVEAPVTLPVVNAVKKLSDNIGLYAISETEDIDLIDSNINNVNLLLDMGMFSNFVETTEEGYTAPNPREAILKSDKITKSRQLTAFNFVALLSKLFPNDRYLLNTDYVYTLAQELDSSSTAKNNQFDNVDKTKIGDILKFLKGTFEGQVNSFDLNSTLVNQDRVIYDVENDILVIQELGDFDFASKLFKEGDMVEMPYFKFNEKLLLDILKAYPELYIDMSEDSVSENSSEEITSTPVPVNITDKSSVSTWDIGDTIEYTVQDNIETGVWDGFTIVTNYSKLTLDLILSNGGKTKNLSTGISINKNEVDRYTEDKIREEIYIAVVNINKGVALLDTQKYLIKTYPEIFDEFYSILSESNTDIYEGSIITKGFESMQEFKNGNIVWKSSFSKKTETELQKILDTDTGTLRKEGLREFLSKLTWESNEIAGKQTYSKQFKHDKGIKGTQSNRIVEGKLNGETVISFRKNAYVISDELFSALISEYPTLTQNMPLLDFLELVGKEKYESLKTQGWFVFVQDYDTILNTKKLEVEMFDNLWENEDKVTVIDYYIDEISLNMANYNNEERILDKDIPFNFIKTPESTFKRVIIKINKNGKIEKDTIQILNEDTVVDAELKDRESILQTITDSNLTIENGQVITSNGVLGPGYYTVFTYSIPKEGVSTNNLFLAKVDVTLEFNTLKEELLSLFDNTVDSLKQFNENYGLKLSTEIGNIDNYKNDNVQFYTIDVKFNAGNMFFQVTYFEGTKKVEQSIAIPKAVLQKMNSKNDIVLFMNKYLKKELFKPIKYFSIFANKEISIDSNLSVENTTVSYKRDIRVRYTPKILTNETVEEAIINANNIQQETEQTQPIDSNVPETENIEKVPFSSNLQAWLVSNGITNYKVIESDNVLFDDLMSELKEEAEEYDIEVTVDSIINRLIKQDYIERDSSGFNKPSFRLNIDTEQQEIINTFLNKCP